MTENQVSREQAIAVADEIEELMETYSARLRAARLPDSRVPDYRNASSLRRSARRIRAVIFKPDWPNASTEEMASAYDYTAEYEDLTVDVQRIKGTLQRVDRLIENGMFAEVSMVFDRLKEKLDTRRSDSPAVV